MEQNYRENPNRLLIVTGNERLSRRLLVQLRGVFGDSLGAACYTRFVDDPALFQTYCALNPGLIVGMSEESADYAAAHSQGFPIIRGTFYLQEPANIDKLFLLPPGKEALVINKTKLYAEQTIQVLEDMNIRHLNYHPYYEGCTDDVSGFDTAISPSVFNYGPPNIPHRIDIGFRCFSIESCAQIARAFALPDDYLTNYLRMQGAVLTQTFKDLSGTYLKAQHLANTLQSMIDNLDEAIVALDKESRIVALNALAVDLFRLKRETALGSDFPWLRDHGDLEQDVLATQEDWKTIVSVGDRQCYMTMVTAEHGEVTTRILRFRDVNRVQANDSNMRRLLYQKHKGHVAKYRFDNLCVADPAMRKVVDTARSLSGTDYTILITGESGTGKELLASSIHNASDRANRPFVAANFAAIPENLIESELFGYEEGAFTGAKKHGKAGLFELAHTGTIFLDEIGDASLSVQARLLRVLEEKEIMRVGDTKVTPIDVRVIAATNKDLRELIRQGLFRSDLYFRINVFQLMLPPLRERPESVFPLISTFSKGELDRACFTEEAAKVVEGYDWPGNLRELRNMVDYISIMRARKRRIGVEQLPMDITAASDREEGPQCRSADQIAGRFGRRLVLAVLELLAQNRDGEIRFSRAEMLQVLQGRGLRCSATTLRAILSELERQGLLLPGKTRQGTRLSPAGQRLLNALHAEEG